MMIIMMKMDKKAVIIKVMDKKAVIITVMVRNIFRNLTW